ncbi:MAG: GNAT family N-acetyltransferase [bacterium LCO1.1]|uniref:GNAT family N-acetyltransferase n=1 Tax=Candidatus Weimeria bifida TaxID=2599074 RepID=A0A6N7IYC1_9FIRM|nr:GNAT family N-acetyltransferase [Candidatus Weimeria bifida]
MQAKQVKSSLAEYRDIKALMKRAFPENEQSPFWMLRMLALRKTVDFLAWYKDGQFCGISYTAADQNGIFVLYLAVNDAIRSKGFGSKILSALEERRNGRNILLNVEMPDEKAANALQRKKRLEFYERNGYHKTNAWIIDGGAQYLILSLMEQYDLEDYQNLLQRFSFGFYRPDIRM